MLDARYLANLSDDLIELYSKLEFEIKKDIFKRLYRLQKITDATTYQAEILAEVGGLKSDIKKLVEQYDVKARKELTALYNDAIQTATNKDLRYFKQAGRELSENQTQIIKTSIDRLLEPDRINKTYAAQSAKFEEIYSSLTRMTATVADATEKQFIKAANNAYMQVSSGARSWQTAYRSAVTDLAKNGVKASYKEGVPVVTGNTVKYSANGTRNVVKYYSIESATKMNILTGINQTASQQTIENCGDLDTDLVEVSAHIGARPEHEVLQGKVYCLDGERDFIDGDGIKRHAPNFNETCHIGEPGGICGINCRHSFYPYFEGTPLEYSKGELSEMKEKTVELDGKKITPYEAEQDLRLCERNIRTYKSEVMGFELMKDTEDNTSYIKARNNLYSWQEKARHITNETGIKRKYINEYIGTKDGTQPRGLKPKDE